MAIFHLHIKHIGRSDGKSAVAASAYRSGSKMSEISEDGQVSKIYNFINKKGVAFSKIFAPKDSSIWMKDRESLWNIIQNKFDKRVNSVFAQEIDVALPIEFSLKENKELLSDFVQEVLVSEGMIADVNIHMDNPKNPHAHLMLSTREVIKDEKGDITFGKKVRYWDKREFLIHVRKSWADFVNYHFANKGMDIRISHLSNKDRNIDLKPSIKEGVGRIIGNSDRIKINAGIRDENSKRIVQNPEMIIELLASSKAVFTREDIEKEIARHFDGGNISLLKSVLSHERLGVFEYRDLEGRILYKDNVRSALERHFINGIIEIKEQDNNFHNLHVGRCEIGYKNSFEKIAIKVGVHKAEVKLSNIQEQAILDIVNSGSISLLEGLAGSGKTSVMREVSRIYKRHNRKIIASAVSSAASNILGESLGVKAINTTKLRYEIENSYNFQMDLKMESGAPNKSQKIIDSNTILIIDEATMVDLSEMNYFVSLIKREGAKLILIGDRNQLSSVRLKGAYSKIAQYFQPAVLEEVRRQENELDRIANQNIAKKDIISALKIFQQKGNLVFNDNLTNSINGLVRDYVEYYLDNPDSKIQALAYRREEVGLLNKLIRQNLIVSGHIEDRDFSVGDRVVFTRNDKLLGVLNNDTGIITKNSLGRLRISLDRKSTLGVIKIPISVSVDSKSYESLDYSYATTIYKSQGSSYEKIFGLFDRNINYNSFNVLASRHKKDLKIYIPNELLQGVSERGRLEIIEEILFREDNNSFAKDYKIENREILEDYLESRFLLYKLYKNGNTNNKEISSVFNRRKLLANKICENIRKYRNDLNITGISYRQLLKDSGKVFGKQINNDLFTTGISNNVASLFSNIDSLGKVPLGPIFKSERQEAAENIFKSAEVISNKIITQEEKLASLMDELKSRESYNSQTREHISEITYFQKILFPSFLNNFFNKSPSEVIDIWEEIYSDKSDLKKSCSLLIKQVANIKNKNISDYFSIPGFSKKRQESLLQDNLELYEKNKQAIQEYQNKSFDQMDSLQGEIRKVKSNIPNYEFRYFIEDIMDLKRYVSLNEATQKLEQYIKDSEIENRIDNFKRHASKKNIKPKEILYQKDFSPYEIEEIFRQYAPKINPDGKIKISNSQISSGSLSMNLQNGLWHRFSTSESGNIVSFLKLAGMENPNSLKTKSTKTPHKISVKKDWESLKIVPKSAPKFDPKTHIPFMIDGKKLESIYEYKNYSGGLIGYSVRIIDGDSKSVIPVSYCELGDKKSWRVKGFTLEDSSKPIYGMEKLDYKEDPILIVEGEKTANAASKIFKNHIVISWLGGSSSAGKVNWSKLKDREVYIWPDNDKAGYECAKLISHKIANAACSYKNIFIIDTEKMNLPNKWDLADSFPESMRNIDPNNILESSKIDRRSKDIPNFTTEKERRIYWQKRVSGEILNSKQVANIAMKEEGYYRILDSDSCKEYSKYLHKRGDIEKTHEFLGLKQEFYKEMLVSVAMRENIPIMQNTAQFLDQIEEIYQEKIGNFKDHLSYIEKYKNPNKEKHELYNVILRDILFIQKNQNNMIIDRDKENISKDLIKILDNEINFTHEEDKLRIANKAYTKLCCSNYFKEKEITNVNEFNIEKDHSKEINQRKMMNVIER